MAAKSNPKPKNATPTSLKLTPPIIPRLPFSSPMGEEILSPTSPNSRTPPQDRPSKFTAAGGQKEDTQNWRGLALDMLAREGKGPRKDESPRRPGLNVVTNFPPRTSSSSKATLDGSKKNFTMKNDDGNTKLDISDQPQSRHVRQASSKSLRSAGSKSRLDMLRRADSKVSNLSPSDRAVVIGISLPQDEVAEHTKSAISPGREEDRTLGSRLNRDRRQSHAPSIVITPAKDVGPWSSTDEEKASLPKPRAISSVYSQGPGSNKVIDSSIVPPVPALPPEVKHKNLRIKTKPEQSARVTSTCTIFDEEADPTMASRPDSAHSQLRILKRSSMDTLATRPCSEGWWNSIMSPFWPKSPMQVKTLPRPRNGVQPDHDRNTLIEDEDVSPIDEKEDGMKSVYTSWTDSPMIGESEKPVLTFDQILPSHHHTRSVTALQPESFAQDATITPARLEGFGAADEYFKACLHDMRKPKPFFQCQNHRCLPREFEANGICAEDLGGLGSRGMGLEAPDAWEASKKAEPRALNGSQLPTNRSSESFQEANSAKPRERPVSEATVIEDLDETPDVHEAHIVPIVKAPEPIPLVQPATIREELEPEDSVQPSRPIYRSPPPQPVEAFEQPRKARRTPLHPPAANPPLLEERPPKRYVAVLPPDPPQRELEEPGSPPPPTPGPQTQAPTDALPLRDIRAEAEASRPVGDTYIINHNYHPSKAGLQTSLGDFFPPPRFKPYPKEAKPDYMDTGAKDKKQRERKKKEKLTVNEPKPSVLSRLQNCCGHRRKDVAKGDEKMSKKKRRMLWLLTAVLVAMITLILLLAMLLHRTGDTMSAQTQWLNITGYPPIPTGVSTIVQPNAADEVAGCVNVPTMWSCALPKEEQQSFSSGAPEQPNFRVVIRFENGTNATSSINSSTNNKRSGTVVNPVLATSFIRRRLIQPRSSLPSSLFIPSPSPPTQEDQTFLGNTTDGNQAPFDGEYTPFFMTFDSPVPLPSASRLAKRDTTTSSSTTISTKATNTSDPFPNLSSAIPAASTESNGTASPANLYPFPSAQPLRLFNRGQSTEHYGFYTYFDRSIFLKSAGLFNGSTINVPDDANGGTLEDAAKVRCTWAQTRFLVQIWTNKGQSYPLLPSDGNANGTTQKSAPAGQNVTTLANSSANDLSRPGSFPYPVTITLDRHGGDIKTKDIYCNGLDDSEKPVSSEKKIQLEDRGYRGTLVNPASGPFSANKVGLVDGGPGGIDGGSGGCSCRWQNWN